MSTSSGSHRHRIHKKIRDAIAAEQSLSLDESDLKVLDSMIRDYLKLMNPGLEEETPRPNISPADVLSGTPLQEAYHHLLMEVVRAIATTNIEVKGRDILTQAIFDSLKTAI